MVDSSRRTTRANAFFAGLGKNRRIALFDTLIRQHTVPEIVAVLAHEVGHSKKKHIAQGSIISFAHAGVLLFLLSLLVKSGGMYEAFRVAEPSVYAGLALFGLLYAPVEIVLGVAMRMLSRRNEYEADRFAAETTAAPAALVSALKKLVTHQPVKPDAAPVLRSSELFASAFA